ncbi:hypothetical protein AH04_15 [Erwinia phage AH04]|uniref:Uncharacterized protein n=1 Tax=Erwinia phage AH04 TaxID=2869569 RepID=A0AAE7X0E0_9CAUD|nr:hypothetical protein PQC02_gp015 [Erwinia phage AH04]QZA70505.1 hypothetical protein AH04_15 [Erwinia phage AH04]
MDFDLDDLAFDGLDEAEARNKERQDEANKEAAAIGDEADCEGCKI